MWELEREMVAKLAAGHWGADQGVSFPLGGRREQGRVGQKRRVVHCSNTVE